MNAREALQHVGAIAQQTDTKVYAVGGFVRDQLLARPYSKDIDCVVDGSGVAFATAFSEAMGEDVGSVVLFEEFDTARYVFTKSHKRENEHGEIYIEKEVLFELEFAGARKETYQEDSRKPAVVQTTLAEDLSRRDFTVNAMAQVIHSDGSLGDIFDPFHGQEDLEAKLLRTPLNPIETFHDDPLRMMRAARFASQLQFTIDQPALDAMQQCAERLSIISAERIREELMKIMGTPVPSFGLAILYQTGLFEHVLPEVCMLAGVEEVKGYSHKDNLSHTLAVVDNIAETSSDPLLRFAGLMHDIAKPQTKKFEKGRGWTFDMHEHLGRKMTKDIMRRLRFRNNDVHHVSELVRWHLQPIALMDKGVTDSAVRRLIVNLGEKLEDLLVLCQSDITTGNQKKKEKRLKNYAILRERIDEVIASDELRAFQSPVRGDEIMEELGLKPGPTVGRIKSAIEEAILDGKVKNDYEGAKAYFDEIKNDALKEAADWERA